MQNSKNPLWFERWLKARYVVAASLVLLAVAVTPFLMEFAYLERGYRAHGGEYMLIPFSIFVALMIISTASELDRERCGCNGSSMYKVRPEVENSTVG